MWLGGKVNQLRSVQTIKIQLCWQMVWEQTGNFFLENLMDKILCDCKIQTDRLLSGRRPNLVLINNTSHVSWVCRIHRIHLCWGVRQQPKSVRDMTLNNMMARLQPWSLGNVEYPFIAIARMPTQTQSGSTW